MKVIDLARALEEVPGLLRTAASELRAKQSGSGMEKVASKQRIRRAVAAVQGDSSEDPDLSDETLEKVARALASVHQLGEMSDESDAPGSVTKDSEFLESLRHM